MSVPSVIFYIATFVCLSSPTAMATPKVSAKVALVFDLTGKRKPALDVVRGIEQAAEELKKNGIELTLTQHNSQNDADGTRVAMAEALKSSPDIIIAEIDSSKAFVAAEIAEQAKRVMITPYATSPLVTKDKKYVFRACFSDNFQGKQLANFAKRELKAKKAAVIMDASQLYSKTLGEAFKESFPSGDTQIVFEEKILPSQSSFKDQIKKIEELAVDVVFLPTYDETAARFINESIQLGVTKPTFLGGDGWGATPTFTELVAKKDTGHAFWVSHYSRDFKNPQISKVAKVFEKKYDKNFTDSAAIGYDTAMIAAQILASAGKNKSQDNLLNEFHKAKPYKGLTGTIHYGPQQDPKKSLFVLGMKSGATTLIQEIKP